MGIERGGGGIKARCNDVCCGVGGVIKEELEYEPGRKNKPARTDACINTPQPHRFVANKPTRAPLL